ncbi:hypothetical protein BE20_33255 [Sorangium cellulosum]|nr:hypothetical protein BE20_33255 [Sorangium cellulosum]
MSKARRHSDRPIRLADSARRRLSRHAVEVFQELDLRRDPEHTTSPDALRALLEARGLPAYEAALELEGLAGGTPLPPDKRLGVFASLKALEGGRPLGPERLPRAGGKVLLPVVANGYPSLWIGEGGTVYLVDTEAARVAPAFDGPAQYLEALAIELETEPWPPEPERLQWHHISVAGLVGAAVAEVFYAPPFAPASGAHTAAWLREHLHIVEQNTPGFFVGTRVTTTDADEAVAWRRRSPRTWRCAGRGPSGGRARGSGLSCRSRSRWGRARPTGKPRCGARPATTASPRGASASRGRSGESVIPPPQAACGRRRSLHP